MTRSTETSDDFPRQVRLGIDSLTRFESLATARQQQLAAAIGWAAEKGFPLPAGNEIAVRLDAVKAFANFAELAKRKITGGQVGISVPIGFEREQVELLLFLIEAAIADERKSRADKQRMVKNPDLLKEHDQAIERLENVRKWDLFKGVDPLPSVGLSKYFGEKEIDQIESEHAALIRQVDGSDDAPATANVEEASEDSRLVAQYGVDRSGLTRRLRWIQDPDIRKILNRDIRHAAAQLEVKQFKSALILAGGAIEEILRQLLQAKGGGMPALDSAFSAVRKGKPPTRVDDYSFADRIDVAEQLALIDRAQSRLLHGVRDFRNFVHIHLEVKQRAITRPDAAMAVQAVFGLIGAAK